MRPVSLRISPTIHPSLLAGVTDVAHADGRSDGRRRHGVPPDAARVADATSRALLGRGFYDPGHAAGLQ